MLPPVRLMTLLLAALLTAGSLAACTDGDEAPDESADAARLPDDLCSVVPANLVTRWRLEPSSHQTEQGTDLSTATCTLAGEVGGEPVDVELAVRAFGGTDAEALAAESLAESCAEITGEDGGDSTESDDSCTWQSAESPRAARGQVREASRVLSFPGVATVSMRHAGRQWQLVPAEVVVLGARLTQSELQQS